MHTSLQPTRAIMATCTEFMILGLLLYLRDSLVSTYL